MTNKDSIIELELAGKEFYRNPSPDIIRGHLEALKGGIDSFAIITSGKLYMQTAGDTSSGFILEYQDGSIDNHWRAANQAISLEDVVFAFQCFALGDDQWRNKFEWEKFELG
jgi:hypothetical protein